VLLEAREEAEVGQEGAQGAVLVHCTGRGQVVCCTDTGQGAVQGQEVDMGGRQRQSVQTD